MRDFIQEYCLSTLKGGKKVNKATVKDAVKIHDLILEVLGDDDTDRMTFGKHKGKYITDVPKDYLKWIHDNKNDKTSVELICKIEEILNIKYATVNEDFS